MPKIIIIGSENFTDYDYLESKLNELFSSWSRKRKITILLMARNSVNDLVEKYRKDHPIFKETETHFSSSDLRTFRTMVKSATHCIMFQTDSLDGLQEMFYVANTKRGIKIIEFNPNTECKTL